MDPSKPLFDTRSLTGTIKMEGTHRCFAIRKQAQVKTYDLYLLFYTNIGAQGLPDRKTGIRRAHPLGTVPACRLRAEFRRCAAITAVLPQTPRQAIMPFAVRLSDRANAPIQFWTRPFPPLRSLKAVAAFHRTFAVGNDDKLRFFGKIPQEPGKISTLASSSAASISSRIQKGEASALKSQTESQWAVNARSPPESSDINCSFLPGGWAMISIPELSGSFSSAKRSCA